MKKKKKNLKWVLNANISFAFNGTKEEAIEKLSEDMDFLEEEVFVRDSMEYMVSNKTINNCIDRIIPIHKTK